MNLLLETVTGKHFLPVRAAPECWYMWPYGLHKSRMNMPLLNRFTIRQRKWQMQKAWQACNIQASG